MVSTEAFVRMFICNVSNFAIVSGVDGSVDIIIIIHCNRKSMATGVRYHTVNTDLTHCTVPSELNL